MNVDRSGYQQFTFLDSKGCLWNYNCECPFCAFYVFSVFFFFLLCLYFLPSYERLLSAFWFFDICVCVWSTSNTFTSLTMLHLNICIKAKGHVRRCDITISLESSMHVLVPLEKQKGS